MRSSLKLALSSLVALVILGLIDGKIPEQVKGFVEPFLHHLTFASQGLVVGGFLLWIFEDSLAEQFGPIVRDGFKSIGDSLAGKMVGQGSIGEELGRSLREFAGQFSPGTKQLVDEGRIQEAVARIEKVKDSLAKREEEIAVLLHSEEPRDWERVLSITNEFNLTSRYFLTVAYRFWTAGNVGRAIEVAEEGFHNEDRKGQAADLTLIHRFQNSLAYYYADAQRRDKADLALQYSAIAHKERPEDPTPLDTRGYVLITFGQSEDVIRKGVQMCYEAFQKGVGPESLAKHVARAEQRLQLIGKKV